MRIPTASALLLGSLCVLIGCEESGVATLPDKEFTDAHRATCPESPFKPEYPVAPKVAASAQMLHFHAEVYTTRGRFVTQWDTDYDSNAPIGGRSPQTRLVWDGRDYRGKEVPSGYYFMLAEVSVPGTGISERQGECFFWINSADQHKVK